MLRRMSFIARHLDPAEILGEFLFGAIMVLTFTLGAAVAGGYERGLLLAAVLCNVAWGVIDGVLVVLSNRYARRRRGSLVRAIRNAPDEQAALDAIREEVAEADVRAKPEDLEQLYRSLHVFLARADAVPMRLTGGDWITGFAVFLLVVGSAVPAALPFFVIPDPHQALRASNALMIVVLAAVGWQYGRHIGVRPWLSALVLTAIGVGLVALAIPLGG